MDDLQVERSIACWSAMTALREISGVGGGDGAAAIEFKALLCEQLFQCRQKKKDVGLAGAKTHQSNPPDLAFVSSQASANLNAETREQCGANGSVVDAGRNEDGVELW